jgi:hypothetical protein
VTQTFDQLLQRAREDPNILAFWLGGSRGKGLATIHSDHDCTMIVADAALADYRARFHQVSQSELDCVVMSLDELRAYGEWGGPEAWDRYSFAHQTVDIDKTGEVQALVDAKARVPAEARAGFIDAALDHYVNQVYRSLKNFRDGRSIAARLEAAEQIPPLLDALFALHDGRLRPFHKYLEWELETWPLDRLPWPSEVFLGKLLAILETADRDLQRQMLAAIETLFRAAGHDQVFDAWGPSLPAMTSGRL